MVVSSKSLILWKSEIFVAPNYSYPGGKSPNYVNVGGVGSVGRKGENFIGNRFPGKGV